jgi:hypothetical protein
MFDVNVKFPYYICKELKSAGKCSAVMNFAALLAIYRHAIERVTSDV